MSNEKPDQTRWGNHARGIREKRKKGEKRIKHLQQRQTQEEWVSFMSAK